MRKPYILIGLAAVMLIAVFGGCDGNTPTIIQTSSTSSIAPTNTTSASEEPIDIQIEYEFTGLETRQLIDVIGLRSSIITQKIIIDGIVYLLKNAIAHVDIWADFYDASGALMGTVEQQYILQGAWAMVSQEFRLTLGIEDPLLVTRCKLTINAYE